MLAISKPTRIFFTVQQLSLLMSQFIDVVEETKAISSG